MFIATTALASGWVSAQVGIAPLDQRGHLTWTNVVPQATYRVEWASSLTGTWKSVGTLTNLLSVQATGSTISVEVPMFYRVVQVDPPKPNPVGTFLYRAYDSTHSSLVATGLVTLGWTNLLQGKVPVLWGTSEFTGMIPSARHPAGAWSLFSIGPDATDGSFSAQTKGPRDDTTYFEGELDGPVWQGTWERIGQQGTGSPLGKGIFRAVKVQPEPQE